MIKYEQGTVIGGRAHFYGNCVATKIFLIWIDVSAYNIIVQEDLIHLDFRRAISSNIILVIRFWSISKPREVEIRVKRGEKE